MRLEVVSKVSRLLDKIKENRAVKDAAEGILQEEKRKRKYFVKPVENGKQSRGSKKPLCLL